MTNMKTKRQFFKGTLATLLALAPVAKAAAKKDEDGNLPESMQKEYVVRSWIDEKMTTDSMRDRISLSDGSLWEIDSYEFIDCVLWMRGDEVAVITGRMSPKNTLYPFTMIHYQQRKMASAKCIRLGR